MSAAGINWTFSAKVLAATMQNAGKTFENILSTSLSAANDVANDASYHFVENILMGKFHQGSLDSFLEQNLDC